MADTDLESGAADPTADQAAESAEVRRFWQDLGLPGLIDVHTHFMPHRLLARIQAYFDAAGPLIGREWPIRYRQDEQRRLEILRGFGVLAFTSLAYPHKADMAASLNAWTADFAARTPDCLHSATFFPEPEAASYVPAAIAAGARVFKAHVQVGGYDPADPLLVPVWGALAEAGIPVIVHCGSGPVATRYTGPEPMARVLARHPALRLVVAHFGLPEYVGFLDLAERYDGVLFDTTMAFTDFFGQVELPDRERKRIAEFEERILFGSDFPNIPYSYTGALEALSRLDFGDGWLRAVCHGNAARIFGV
ncbi:putative TIM-barrel fold metal-dependent hydrolase [Catenulispora sp. GP43]|uniref:amidohydrolase family protein n=1 Tax=Catenulispora sp. GP43 TaxID=3156263 RepID=UPI0035112357